MSRSSSEVSSIVTLARSGMVKKSSVQVNINGHYRSKVYTSGSHINGEVVISPWKDTRFDALHIIFIGTSRTRLDAVQVPQHASHTFLKLHMPISESAYPMPRIFEAGRTYTFPFNFVVPSQLTISACNHHAQSDIIHDYHMRLPPTMGFWEKDDMAPEMSQVEYAIKARVLAQPDMDGRPIKLLEGYQHIQVLPAGIEDPPLSLTKNDKAYTLTKTKSLRKSLFSSKIGRITASAAQPSAIAIAADGRTASSSTATVNLHFEPTSSDVPPPKINTVSAKLTATTYFSASPMTKLPNLGLGRHEFSIDQRLSYQTSVSLFSTNVEKVTWRQQIASQARRDSGYSSDGAANNSDTSENRAANLRTKSRSSPIYHAAALAIPFNIPTTKKMFIPTFHSCLISRVYTLNLTLSVGSSNTSVSLALPIQMVVEGESAVDPMPYDIGLPSFDSVVALQEAQEADEHLRPRTLQIPSAEFQGNSVLPGYEDMAMLRRPVAS